MDVNWTLVKPYIIDQMNDLHINCINRQFNWSEKQYRNKFLIIYLMNYRIFYKYYAPRVPIHVEPPLFVRPSGCFLVTQIRGRYSQGDTPQKGVEVDGGRLRPRGAK